MTQWLAKARARISRGVWGHVPRKMFPMLPAKTSFPDKSLVSVTHKQNIFGAKHIYIYIYIGFYLGFIVWGRSPEWPSFLGGSGACTYCNNIFWEEWKLGIFFLFGGWKLVPLKYLR